MSMPKSAELSASPWQEPDQSVSPSLLALYTVKMGTSGECEGAIFLPTNCVEIMNESTFVVSQKMRTTNSLTTAKLT